MYTTAFCHWGLEHNVYDLHIILVMMYVQYVLIHCCCNSYVWQKVSFVKFVGKLMMLFFHLISLVSFFVVVSCSRTVCALCNYFCR